MYKVHRTFLGIINSVMKITGVVYIYVMGLTDNKKIVG
jgi:hypothetical protein